ncbi:MAG: hypothetical protein U9R50_11830 [Campylobacterota bacterium]|nr:hypothetical protein [Campylobacterota bacterium]
MITSNIKWHMNERDFTFEEKFKIFCKIKNYQRKNIINNLDIDDTDIMVIRQRFIDSYNAYLQDEKNECDKLWNKFKWTQYYSKKGKDYKERNLAFSQAKHHVRKCILKRLWNKNCEGYKEKVCKYWTRLYVLAYIRYRREMRIEQFKEIDMYGLSYLFSDYIRVEHIKNNDVLAQFLAIIAEEAKVFDFKEGTANQTNEIKTFKNVKKNIIKYLNEFSERENIEHTAFNRDSVKEYDSLKLQLQKLDYHPPLTLSGYLSQKSKDWEKLFIEVGMISRRKNNLESNSAKVVAFRDRDDLLAGIVKYLKNRGYEKSSIEKATLLQKDISKFFSDLQKSRLACRQSILRDYFI